MSSSNRYSVSSPIFIQQHKKVEFQIKPTLIFGFHSSPQVFGTKLLLWKFCALKVQCKKSVCRYLARLRTEPGSGSQWVQLWGGNQRRWLPLHWASKDVGNPADRWKLSITAQLGLSWWTYCPEDTAAHFADGHGIEHLFKHPRALAAVSTIIVWTSIIVVSYWLMAFTCSVCWRSPSMRWGRGQCWLAAAHHCTANKEHVINYSWLAGFMYGALTLLCWERYSSLQTVFSTAMERSLLQLQW